MEDEESPRWTEYEKPERRSLEETWAKLAADFDLPRDSSGAPFVLDKMPSFDDEVDGFFFYKTGYEYLNMSGFTLPRSFFGRSLLEWANFTNTDFHESRFCWNDFVDCSFRHADLRGADLRASFFVRCRFDHADLSNADLRGSTFRDCTFVGASLAGCRVVRDVAEDLLLSPEQAMTAEWHEEDGEEAPGG